MRKLALRDEVLMQVEKPARYIGNEINMVKKNPREVDVRFCMCFPDVYEIGMSHLGIQILYDMFNRWDDTYCERVYSPWPDMDKILREKNIPLFALESQEPIFLVLRFSMKCVIPTFCRSWICRTFRCTPVREHGTTRL